MCEFKTVSIQGFCPYLRKTNTIEVKLQKILFSGDITPRAKCIRFSCEYSSECTMRDECPLTVKARTIQHW